MFTFLSIDWLVKCFSISSKSRLLPSCSVGRRKVNSAPPMPYWACLINWKKVRIIIRLIRRLNANLINLMVNHRSVTTKLLNENFLVQNATATEQKKLASAPWRISVTLAFTSRFFMCTIKWTSTISVVSQARSAAQRVRLLKVLIAPVLFKQKPFSLARLPGEGLLRWYLHFATRVPERGLRKVQYDQQWWNSFRREMLFRRCLLHMTVLIVDQKEFEWLVREESV